MPIYQLTQQIAFPPVEMADHGILAVGGDLQPERLLLAYRSGIFPWFSQDEPIIWWSPDPRFLLLPGELRVTKSMKQLLRNKRFRCTLDTAFDQVIAQCASLQRPDQPGTWITEEMKQAYMELHKMGYAHSVEVWEGAELVGGLYGVAIGKVFFGESMFFTRSNASKYGFITLVRELERRQFQFIDCQVETAHLGSLGARPFPRAEFIGMLKNALSGPEDPGNWTHWW